VSELESRLAQLTPAQRSALTARLAASRARTVPDGAIAIIGMACRFPGGANSPDAFWRLLDSGVDAIEPVPAERWDAAAFFDADPDAVGKSLSRAAGFITGVADFDAEYFGIAPFEARQMDPQQRLFLEVALEALDAAGLTRSQLAGSACGVYVGVHSHSNDYYQMQSALLETVDIYTSTGTAHSVVANRLSYFLDLRGPSMAIDTACSSSLVALHQACMSLRAGESDLAVTGGLNLMLIPDFSVSLTKLRVLSPSGRCRTFDAAADGIARGEGCGAVVLKRAVDALRDGDQILALVRGSAVNQDGATNGMTAPSTPSQVAVIRTALSSARVEASRVNFVETHGTGTPLGDPIEVEAIATVYGAARVEGDPVVLGAVKTNIGHLEGAAGIASVIKTVLCLQHQRIPKNLHFVTQNPLLPPDDRQITLPLEARAWAAPGGTRIGAVSSFGFGGTNAHVILEEAPTPAPPLSSTAHVLADGTTIDAEVLPLVLSAHSADALRAQVEQWRSALRTTLRDADVRDLAYTAAVRRTAFAHRVAVTGADVHTWADRLDAWVRARDHDTLPPLPPGERRKVAFAFCGQGSQWFAMGRELAAREPLFHKALAQVATAVSRHVTWNLLEELARDEFTSRIHETEITQPAMFAIQMGLVALWRSWGVEPDFVIAHSSGEIAAACTAGAIDLEEGARIAVLRGRAVSQSEGQGVMVAYPISAVDASVLIAGMEDRVAIAAMNGPTSVVLAGDSASLTTINDQLKDRGIDGRWLQVRYASHCPQMERPAAWLHDALGTVQHRAPVVPMYSSISHTLVHNAMLDASHWAVGLRRPVDFAGGVRAALAAGCRAFVDIAPHPVMAGNVRECAEDAGLDVVAVPSLRRNVSDRAQLMQSACELFTAGVDPDWGVLLGARGRVVALPAYPWQHVRYWLTAPHATRAVPTAPAAPAAYTNDATVSELHEVRWVPAVVVGSPTSPSSAWVVLGGPAELAAGLVAQLAQRTGVPCQRLIADGDEATVASAVASGSGVIDLRALHSSSGGSVGEVATSTTMAAQQLLRLAAAGAEQAESPSRVWIVTRGAVAANAAERPEAAQAAVWGLGRVAVMEMPATFGGLLDLDPSATATADIDAIADAVTQAFTEYESAFRAARRLVPRLRPMPVTASQPVLRADGYYVVAGGLGGVGRVVARWLVAQGATRVLLLGRTALPARERWSDGTIDVETRTRISAVQQLEASGAVVEVAAQDVSDTAAMRRLAAARTASGWGSACGILHCATDVQFGLVAEITADAVQAMMRSKIGGAESLLDAFAADAPDFVVLFSSMAAWLGERGQGAYAAANAVLDAWALARRRTGAPISVINWGAWEDTGLAASRGGELVTDGLRQRGVLPVPPAAATTALGAVIAQRVAVATVFRAGKSEIASPALDPWSLLRDLPGSALAASDVVKVSVPDEVRAIAGTRAQLARVTVLVREIIADTLGLEAAPIEVERPLGALGMDSLMAIRIRRRCERLFEITLPATALFSYPTVSALAGLLLERLGLDAVTEPPVPAAATGGAPMSPAMTALSDDEALNALRTRRTAPRRSST